MRQSEEWQVEVNRLCMRRGRWVRALWAIAAMVLLCCGTTYARSGGQRQNSVAPEVRIPIGNLGYFPPGERPAFDYYAAVSLHFIDNHHLLFAFGVKGLLKRGHSCATSETQRIVRAVVVELPSGKVDKQADWNLYDFSDFLWNIGGGQFLLRRCNSLSVVGGDLVLHPFLQTDEAIQAVALSPDHAVAVVETERKLPVQAAKSYADVDGPEGPARPVTAVFLRLRPPGYIVRANLPTPTILPLVKAGLVETLVAKHRRWVINLKPFHEPDRKIAEVKSFCQPHVVPIGDDVVVIGFCPAKSTQVFAGYTIGGAALWTLPLASDHYEPRVLLFQDGSRFAIESLHAKVPIAALDPLGEQNIDGEIVDIYDTRTGAHLGSFDTTPVYTAGENIDFSPDGRRMAVIHDGAIEIYSVSEMAKNRIALR